MAEFVISGDDASLVVDRLTPQQRDQLSHDGSRLIGPSAVINVVAAMDLPALRKDFLLGYAAMKRFQRETGGLSIGGMSVRTDRESQALINGAFNMARENSSFTTKFKTAAGFVEIDAETIIAVALAVGAHVASCFALEETAFTAIEAGEITTRAQVDELFAAADAPPADDGEGEG